jgi:hypothetical protein
MAARARSHSAQSNRAGTAGPRDPFPSKGITPVIAAALLRLGDSERPVVEAPAHAFVA